MPKKNESPESLLLTANLTLERVKLRVKGNKIYIRGTFPPKPGDGDKAKQYDISTKLALNPEGIKIARARAQKLESEMNLQQFSWDNYLGEGGTKGTIEDWTKRFEEHYWQTHVRTKNRESSYYNAYIYPFKKLPPDEPLTEEVLRRVLSRSPSDSCTRATCYIAYKALAEFAQINAKLKDLRGNYKPKVKRIIPPDEHIEAIRESIKNPAYQWIFGMLAAYGLRPHEIFYLDCSRIKEEPHILQVQENTKTHEHTVFPILGRWVNEWKLWEAKMPRVKVEDRANCVIGNSIGKYFRKNHLGITPTHLRDAYAIRGEIEGYPVATVAQWMGHGLDVHYRHYLKFIDESAHAKVWNKINNRSSREDLGNFVLDSPGSRQDLDYKRCR